MSLRWMILAYIALSILATLAYVVGASIGYRKGWLEARRLPGRAADSLRLCLPFRESVTRRSHRPRHVLRGNIMLPPARPPWNHQRVRPSWIRALHPLSAAVVALAVVALAIPATAATASALPGQPLWSAKLGLERIQLVMARDQRADARLRVEFAERRVNELAAVAGSQFDAETLGLISSVADQHTRAAAEEVAQLPADDESAASLGARVEAAAEQQEELLAVLASAACTEEAACLSADAEPPRGMPASSASASGSLPSAPATDSPSPAASDSPSDPGGPSASEDAGDPESHRAPGAVSSSAGTDLETPENPEEPARDPTASAPATSERGEESIEPLPSSGDQTGPKTDRPQPPSESPESSDPPQTAVESSTPTESSTVELPVPPPSEARAREPKAPEPEAPEPEGLPTAESSAEEAVPDEYGRNRFQDTEADLDGGASERDWHEGDGCGPPSDDGEQGADGALPGPAADDGGGTCSAVPGDGSEVADPAVPAELGLEVEVEVDVPLDVEVGLDLQIELEAEETEGSFEGDRPAGSEFLLETEELGGLDES